MSSWWANKLGTSQTPPRQSPFAPAPQQTVAAPVWPQQPQQQPPAPQEEFVPNEQNPTKVSEVLPIWQWKGNPRGAAGDVTGNCPGCGSPRFFSRRSGAITTANGVVYPAPECADCGYPRDQGEIGIPSQVLDGGKAPSAEAPAPPGTLASLRRG